MEDYMEPEVSLMGKHGALSRQFRPKQRAAVVIQPRQQGKTEAARQASAHAEEKPTEPEKNIPAAVALPTTGAELAAWLERSGMSQAQFAKATGMTPKTVGRHVKSERLPKWLPLAIRGMEAIG
ncbi:MAG: helix-turn-helix transcriptional regulator [Oricola sp.]|jgi:DNA-binding transcriptional regulator YiaG|nr:helix-turn-helix transcriptional regulator [Oricola sp.]